MLQSIKAAALLALLASLPLHADVYECTLDNGKKSFQSSPCPTGEQRVAIKEYSPEGPDLIWEYQRALKRKQFHKADQLEIAITKIELEERYQRAFDWSKENRKPTPDNTPDPVIPELKTRAEYYSDSQQICAKNWTKRGELDSRMYNHCLSSQMDGYDKLRNLHGHADETFYSQTSFPYCRDEWTKRGIADTRMMAHCLEQEVEGIRDVMYYREQFGTDAVNFIVGEALNTFNSWRMAAYKVKQRFDP